VLGIVDTLRADMLSRIIVRLVNACSPILLLFEDAHWIDDLSARLIHAVGNQCQGASIVVTTRPNFAFGDEHSVMNMPVNTIVAPIFQKFHLGPLSEDESVKLLTFHSNDSRLKDRAVVQRTPSWDNAVLLVARKSGGIPLYLKEMGKAMRIASSNEIKFGEHRTAHLFKLVEDPPLIFARMVESRMNQVTWQCREVLKCASAFSVSFSIGGLLDLVQLEFAVDLDVAVQNLVQVGFVIRVKKDGDAVSDDELVGL
jgi:predicted ATPase